MSRLHVLSYISGMMFSGTVSLLMSIKRASRNGTVNHSSKVLTYAITGRRRWSQCNIWKWFWWNIVEQFAVLYDPLEVKAVTSALMIKTITMFSVIQFYCSTVSLRSVPITSRRWCRSTIVARTPYRTTVRASINSNTSLRLASFLSELFLRVPIP